MTEAWAFRPIIDQFKEQINAIDDLARTVNPHLDKLRVAPPFLGKVGEQLKLLESEDRDIALAIMSILPDLWESAVAGDDDATLELCAKINGISSDFAAEFTEESLLFKSKRRELGRPIFEFYDGIRNDSIAPSHQELLRRSMLAMCVGTFESYLGRLYRQQLKMHPAILNSADKVFSLEEIQSFDSLDDAVNALIDREVDRFTRGGIDEWDKWLKKPALNLSMSDAAASWVRTREVFERRNLVLHRDCKVSPQYLAKVPNSETEGIAVGDYLGVSDDYLETAIEQILCIGIALGLRMWEKLSKSNVEPSKWIVDEQVNFLERGRPSVALHLGAAIKPDSLPPFAQLQIRVNEWIARKEISGLDDVAEEVGVWDTSQLADLYIVAKAALLEDHAEAAAGVRKLINRDDLDYADLWYWPLFGPLRDSGLVDDLLAPGRNGGELEVQLKSEEPPAVEPLEAPEVERRP